MHQPGMETEPVTQESALDWESKPQPFGVRSDALTNDQHQAGFKELFLFTYNVFFTYTQYMVGTDEYLGKVSIQDDGKDIDIWRSIG